MEKEEILKLKPISKKQMAALHVYFDLVSERLNEAGLEQKVVLRLLPNVPWNKTTVKEGIWRPIQEAQLMKISTRQLNTKDVDKVWDSVNRFLSENFHIHEPFPSIWQIEQAIIEENEKKRFQKKS